jgi:hypothetical protein
VPLAIDIAGVMLKVVVAPGVKVLALSCAVIPAGAPAIVTVSGALKVPLGEPHDNCTLADNPAFNVTLAGLLASTQVGIRVTTKLTAAV